MNKPKIKMCSCGSVYVDRQKAGQCTKCNKSKARKVA